MSAVLSVSVVFVVLPVLDVILRVIARRVVSRTLDISDYLIVAACVFSLALKSISITAGIGYGHVTDVAAEYGTGTIVKLFKLMIPLEFTVFLVSYIIWTSMAGIAFIVMWAIAVILAGCLIWQPFAFKWDQTIPGAITTTSVGLLTCVVSGICIHSLASIDFTDITMSLPQANISSGLEPAVAVTLACVPLLRPLPGRGKFSSSGTSNYASFGGSKRNGGCETRNAAPGPISDDSSQYRLRSLSPKYDVEITVSGKTDSSGGRSSELEAEERRGITARSEWAIAEERKPGKAGRRMY
ncbi:hypothetical protein NKR23_g5658 [Pleurostoma richardsiae]|uniref:Integral membrane protein n=1 Tax=Pleurostoma richardsiae TaxID=41990 RepID=A0AA38VET1_9PEZI|nr:hypothetical protein NKR23_g5658 [Pleurostoma richardsiae]